MSNLHHPYPGLLLVRQDKQTMILISKDVMTIGRRQTDIMLDDAKVSSSHAEIRRESDGRYLIKDSGSTNGTFVNRRPITSHHLSDQDVIEIGGSTLCFFNNSKDFNGKVEEKINATSLKVNEPTQKTQPTSVTLTPTLTQPVVKLRILKGPDQGKTFQFRKSHILVGRSEGDLMLLDMDVSRSHTLLEILGPGTIFLRDLESTNGTILNGKRISHERVKIGDRFTVGNTEILIEAVE